MGQRLSFILGGARSGKSDWALALARKRAGDSVLFVATAQAGDDEMRTRILSHRAARPAAWATLEAPRDLAHALESVRPPQLVLVDCVTLWMANVMLEDEDSATGEMVRQVEELLAWYQRTPVELILVSNEVGSGVVPPYESGRLYRDLLGAINRKIAAEADQVFWMVAGLAVEVKSLAKKIEDS